MTGRHALVLHWSRRGSLHLARAADGRSDHVPTSRLSQLLSDIDVAAFEVDVCHDPTAEEARLQLLEFVVDRSPAEVGLLWLTADILVDTRGRCHVMTADTDPTRPTATALPIDFVWSAMRRGAARHILMIDGIVHVASQDKRSAESISRLDLEELWRGSIEGTTLGRWCCAGVQLSVGCTREALDDRLARLLADPSEMTDRRTGFVTAGAALEAMTNDRDTATDDSHRTILMTAGLSGPHAAALVARTPDGPPIAGAAAIATLQQRASARAIDIVVFGAIMLVLMSPAVFGIDREALAEARRQPLDPRAVELFEPWVTIALHSAVVAILAIEALGLATRGGSIGKLLIGIQVRFTARGWRRLTGIAGRLALPIGYAATWMFFDLYTNRPTMLLSLITDLIVAIAALSLILDRRRHAIWDRLGGSWVYQRASPPPRFRRRLSDWGGSS